METATLQKGKITINEQYFQEKKMLMVAVGVEEMMLYLHMERCFLTGRKLRPFGRNKVQRAGR